jgi:hypothetical protein
MNMTRARKLRKVMLSVTAVLAGGTVLSNGCINTLASIPICGTVLTFCTPVDQLNMMFPLLETPDYDTDPSCTIPLGCGGGDIYQNIPPGFPGGEAPVEPQDESQGIGGGGGGGGI